jgi:signal transduction histidine kinase
MNIFQKIRPKFWDTEASKPYGQILFNYRRVWLVSIFLLIVVSLVPLSLFMMFNLNLAHDTIENENHLRIARIASNTRRTITYFLEERLDALRFIIRKERVQKLISLVELSYIFQNLKRGFGGFLDIGVIHGSGVQITYVGPFSLEGKNYSDQEWFVKCLKTGSYVSDVFLGYRKVPHMIVAVRSPKHHGAHYILRATLDIKKFTQILSSLELSAKSDAFVCNRDGLLQTPSRYYGKLLKKMDLSVPDYSPHTQVINSTDNAGRPIMIGYAYIERSPYILMLVKRREEIMKGWHSLRDEMIWFFSGSSIVIFIVILGMSTFMVSRVHDAEQTRLKAMEKLEGSSRLISLGRLAAGVAHEINNPLAVINENAGLIKDIFTFKKTYQQDPQLMELIDAVLESVERSGEITKQLLGFARHFEPKIEPIQLEKVLSEVLSFLRKEALYRDITINMDIPENFPVIHSDHGSLQQIFLNLVNNAFQAMDNGGRLDISSSTTADETVSISIMDNGSGISEEDKKRIFEPFFTTRDLKGGTGLGLSITYGLIRKLGGNISVQSKIGKGTTFTVTLPVNS